MKKGYAFSPKVVSMALILRDYASAEYANDEHRMLVDIADAFYNGNLGVEHLKTKYKVLYYQYGELYFNKVLEDAYTIDSQLENEVQIRELARDYEDYLDEHFIK